MNYILVILGVVLVVALYFLYVYLTNDNLSSGIQDLKVESVTKAKDLKSPGSTIFSYQFWMFLTETNKDDLYIVKRNSDNKVDFGISIQGTELKLKNNPSGSNDKETVFFTATDKFPIQKWTHVVVNYNASTKLAECYINGKLVYTQQTKEAINITSSYGLTVGTSGLKGYITKLVYLPETLTSDAVWSKYLEGNGQLSISAYFAGYNLNMAVSKDDVVQKNWKLFT